MKNYRYNNINPSNKTSIEIEMEDIPNKIAKPPNERNNAMKILIVGAISAGMSAFCTRYVKNYFSEYLRSTIGVAFYHKEVICEDEKKIDLHLWDIASSERYGSMSKIYYQESNAAIILFDITRTNSFYDASWWIDDIRSKVKTSENNPIPCLLIGNKCDLNDEVPPEIQEKIDDLISSNQIIGFYKTSCLKDINVKESAEFIVNYVNKNNIEPCFEYEQINYFQQEIEHVDTCICKIC